VFCNQLISILLTSETNCTLGHIHEIFQENQELYRSYQNHLLPSQEIIVEDPSVRLVFFIRSRVNAAQIVFTVITTSQEVKLFNHDDIIHMSIPE